MQRMKQLATGVLSMVLATAGVASAGGDQEQTTANPGGPGSQPAPHTGSGASKDPTMTSSVTASSGMSRTQIQQVQRELQSRGLYAGAIDGVAGPQTLAAVQEFQAQQGLTASGTLDDATRRALGVQLDRQPVSGSQTAPGPELERSVGREGGTPTVSGAKPMRSQVQLDRLNRDQLRTLQTRLSELGFYQGSVDGVLGENTRSALRQFFQTQADLASRGIITDATISLFGFSPQGLNPPTGSTSGQSQPGTSPTGTSQGSSGATSPTRTPKATSPDGTQPRGSEPRDSTRSPGDTSTPRPERSQPQPANPSQGTP